MKFPSASSSQGNGSSSSASQGYAPGGQQRQMDIAAYGTQYAPSGQHQQYPRPTISPQYTSPSQQKQHYSRVGDSLVDKLSGLSLQRPYNGSIAQPTAKHARVKWDPKSETYRYYSEGKARKVDKYKTYNGTLWVTINGEKYLGVTA